MRKMICAAVSLVLLSACEFVHSPTDVEFGGRPLVVHSVLAAGDSTARVLLTTPKVGGFDRITGSLEDEADPVRGAEVWLVGAGDSLQLKENRLPPGACYPVRRPELSDGLAGCYSAAIPGQLRAGQEWRLTVRAEGFPVATGVGIIPTAPEILEIDGARVRINDPDDSFSAGSADIRYRSTRPGLLQIASAGQPRAFSSEAADSIACTLFSSGVNRQVESGVGEAELRYLSGECVRFEGNSREPVLPDSVVTEVVVTQFSDSYLSYFLALDGKRVSQDQLSHGLEGAFGVFAGSASARQSLVIATER